MIPKLSETLYTRDRAEAGISREDFVSAQAGERHFYTSSPRLARNEICINAVHRRQVHCAKGIGNSHQNIRLRNADLVMIGVKFCGHGARVSRFGKLAFAKNNRKRAGRYTAAAEDADQRARIDAAGKKDSHRDVADQL